MKTIILSTCSSSDGNFYNYLDQIFLYLSTGQDVCVRVRVCACVHSMPMHDVHPHGHDCFGFISMFLYFFLFLICSEIFFVSHFSPFRQKEMCGICNNKKCCNFANKQGKIQTFLLCCAKSGMNSYLRKQVQITRLNKRPFL